MMKPQILFEDAEILVCHKPAGTAVQTASFSAQDMVSILKNHLALEMRKKETVKGPKTSAPYLAVIHRLDQPVEGILVFGKTKNAAASLTRQLTRNSFKKYYEAMAEGTPPAASGTLTDYLIRDGRTNCSAVCSPDILGSKKAVLEYQVLAQYETNGKCLSHLRIQLQTGRHHQIRVQFSHAGCPLFGDRKYNPDGIPVSRLYLCACQLDFLHPSTGKLLHFEIQPFFYEEFDKSSPS